MEIRELHHQFIRECNNGTLKRRSPVTLKNYQTSFELLMSWFPLKAREELNHGILRQFFRRGEERRGWKASTVISHRKNLSPFLDWLVKRQIFKKNPLREIPSPPLLKRLPEYYTEEEIQKLIYAAQSKSFSEFEASRDTAIIATLLMAGLRKGELIQLKISDVDFASRCIRVRAETSKNREPRAVAMCFRLEEILRTYWENREKRGVETPYFWSSSTRGSGFTMHGLKHLLNRISDRSGVRLKAHKCRHTFATMTYKGSKDIMAVKQALGHQNLETTLIYTHLSPDQMKGALEMNPINECF